MRKKIRVWVLWTRMIKPQKTPWYAVEMGRRRKDIPLSNWENEGCLRQNKLVWVWVTAPEDDHE